MTLKSWIENERNIKLLVCHNKLLDILADWQSCLVICCIYLVASQCGSDALIMNTAKSRENDENETKPVTLTIISEDADKMGPGWCKKSGSLYC